MMVAVVVTMKCGRVGKGVNHVVHELECGSTVLSLRSILLHDARPPCLGGLPMCGWLGVIHGEGRPWWYVGTYGTIFMAYEDAGTHRGEPVRSPCKKLQRRGLDNILTLQHSATAGLCSAGFFAHSVRSLRPFHTTPGTVARSPSVCPCPSAGFECQRQHGRAADVLSAGGAAPAAARPGAVRRLPAAARGPAQAKAQDAGSGEKHGQSGSGHRGQRQTGGGGAPVSRFAVPRRLH
eukprot:356902-Chlamydomonas_euryale.AAC.12